MMDDTAVRIAAERLRRGDLTGALILLDRQGRACPTCPLNDDEWPGRDCETPEFHDRAIYACECGDVLTIADAIDRPDAHRRCNLIGAMP